MKRLISIGMVVAVFAVFGVAQPASAHFVVEDENTGMKAIFHVTPDHDPIAGEESVVSFDFAKTGAEVAGYSYVLTVKSTKGEAEVVPFKVTGGVIVATYTFPTQGFYTIKLTATATNSGAVSVLQYGQRVSRGAAFKEETSFLPIEIAAMLAVTGVAAGAIIYSVKNDRKHKEKKHETKTLSKFAVLSVVALASVLLVPSKAFAHVTVTPSEALTGAYATFTTNVPNEKDIPVTEVRLVIPRAVESVTPTVKPGWEIATKKENDAVTEITWSGGKHSYGAT